MLVYVVSRAGRICDVSHSRQEARAAIEVGIDQRVRVELSIWSDGRSLPVDHEAFDYPIRDEFAEGFRAAPGGRSFVFDPSTGPQMTIKASGLLPDGWAVVRMDEYGAMLALREAARAIVAAWELPRSSASEGAAVRRALEACDAVRDPLATWMDRRDEISALADLAGPGHVGGERTVATSDAPATLSSFDDPEIARVVKDLDGAHADVVDSARELLELGDGMGIWTKRAMPGNVTAAASDLRAKLVAWKEATEAFLATIGGQRTPKEVSTSLERLADDL